MQAPLEVSPGHIMLAPLKTNLIAPLSTCCLGRKNGSEMFQLCYNTIKQFFKKTKLEQKKLL